MTRRRENAVLYARYSKLGNRDAAKLRTLDAQEDAGLEVISIRGMNLVATFEDHGKSGGSLDREGLQSAIAMIESGDANVLVASRLSRLTRSVVDLREIVQRVEAAGGRIVLGDLGDLGGTAAGKMLRDILATVAEFELELARENGLDARKSAIERGVAIMSKVPFGYQKPEVWLVPDPVRGPVMTEVFKRRAAGQTWSQLSAYIEEQTGDYIVPQTLSRMIANPTYLGSVRHGSLVNKQAHPPLVDQETFDAAQSARRLNSNRKHRALLAGLLTCSGCGNPMTYRRQMQKGKTEHYPVYACQRTSTEGRCPLPVMVSARIADEAVSESFLEWSRENMKPVAGDPRDANELVDAETMLADAQRGLDQFLEIGLDMTLDRETLRAAVAQRQGLVDEARDRLTKLRQERRLEGLSSDAASAWQETDSEGRRQMIAAALDGVIVHRTTRRGQKVAFEDRAEITWKPVPKKTLAA